MLARNVVVGSLAVVLASNLGCASMFHGTSQQISIRSNDPNADLYVNEGYVGRGSGVTSFKKSSNYTITARKAGCQPNSVPASKSFDAITLLGVFLDFGIVSVLVVDGAGTGSWQQFDQTNFVVDPVCAAPAPAAQASRTF